MKNRTTFISASERTIQYLFKCSCCGAVYVDKIDYRIADMYNVIDFVECEYCGKRYNLKDVLISKIKV